MNATAPVGPVTPRGGRGGRGAPPKQRSPSNGGRLSQRNDSSVRREEITQITPPRRTKKTNRLPPRSRGFYLFIFAETTQLCNNKPAAAGARTKILKQLNYFFLNRTTQTLSTPLQVHFFLGTHTFGWQHLVPVLSLPGRSVVNPADVVLVVVVANIPPRRGGHQHFMFLLLLPASSALFPRFVFARLPGFGGGGRRLVEEEIAPFQDFIGRRLGSPGSGHRRAAPAAAAARRDGAEAPGVTPLLPGLPESLSAVTVASHCAFPAQFLGLDAPLHESDLLGRRCVEFAGTLRAVVGGSCRLVRLDRRAFGRGGDRRGSRSSSSSGASGAQRVSHLEASLCLLASPYGRRCCFFFFSATSKEAVKGPGLI